MGSETVIRAENISKQYRLGVIDSRTFAEDVKRWWHRKTGKEDPVSQVSIEKNEINNNEKRNLWALKDVSFEIKRGDAVGIIGKNGAGKSTLLKIISRITQPTTGEIRFKGRIGSLLEVGTGFHPELTGRENVFMNGTILGMKKAEIKDKFDEIVAFSGVEKFIDTPVKRYSSGMYVRLAFSVAAHLEPEILIIDEVLSVGDAEFQKKCMQKIKDMRKKEERTVLFVSHNMTAVESLCNNVILLENGMITCNSTAEDALEMYLDNHSEVTTNFNFNDIDKSYGNQYVRILNGSAANADDGGYSISVTDAINISFCVVNYTGEEEISIGFDLETTKGEVVFGTSEKFFCPIGKPINVACKIPANFLNDNHYSVFLYVHTQNMVPLYHHKKILIFQVNDEKRQSDYYGKINGLLRPKLPWVIIKPEQ